jgi:hypothetical protein
MRCPLLLITLFISFLSQSQVNTFPQSWAGGWKGELLWYKTGQAKPQKVVMELRISSIDSARWNWQLVYGKETEDNRPYQLIKKDTTGVHWVIDEKNGIIIDQYWVGNKLSGAFTVMNNTIINNYWLEKGRLVAEFYSISAKPINTTGLGTDESPAVSSYKVGSYQKAILTRIK